jgi:hypothetical protein
MHTVVRHFLICLALFSLVVIGGACGGSDTAEKAGGDAEPSAANTPAPKAGGDKRAETADGSLNTPEAALMKARFKEMAAAEGIYFGEVPEGFPLDFLPLYPDGEIDKSSIGDGDFTLLQNVPGDKDTVFAWYKKFYTGLGWASGNPFTTMGRTMVGFEGSDAEVDMTMIEKDGGNTFVALVLSPR